MQTEKSNGPRTEPCGTPALMLPHDNSIPFMTTRWFPITEVILKEPDICLPYHSA